MSNAPAPGELNARMYCGCWKRLPRALFFTEDWSWNVINGQPVVQSVQCLFHGWTHVVEWKLGEWHADCELCGWSRWFGDDEQGAKVAARGHKRDDRSHDTRVAYDFVGPDGLASILVPWERDAAKLAASDARLRAVKKAAAAKREAKPRGAAKRPARPSVTMTHGTMLSFDDLMG